MNYATSFPGNENPISEGGKWTCGLAVGLDWTDPRTNGSGICFGTQSVHTPPPFDDSIACLSGFGADVTVTGTLHIGSPTGDIEVELYVRMAISAHSARGYEMDILDDGNVYLVRWEGPIDSFTILGAQPIASGLTLTNGDVFKFTAVGTVLTGYQNNTQIFSYDTSGDSIKWSNGNPGMGYWDAGNTGVNTDFCFSHFTADDGLSGGVLGDYFYRQVAGVGA